MSSKKVMGMHPVMGRGVLVFVAGMALSGVAFLAENLIIKVGQGKG